MSGLGDFRIPKKGHEIARVSIASTYGKLVWGFLCCLYKSASA
jgi:hypothetical protein